MVTIYAFYFFFQTNSKNIISELYMVCNCELWTGYINRYVYWSIHFLSTLCQAHFVTKVQCDMICTRSMRYLITKLKHISVSEIGHSSHHVTQIYIIHNHNFHVIIGVTSFSFLRTNAYITFKLGYSVPYHDVCVSVLYKSWWLLLNSHHEMYIKLEWNTNSILNNKSNALPKRETSSMTFIWILIF